jgi:hypothetical protein
VSLLANNINVGLDKLIQATKDVDLMKIELKEKEKGLLVAQEKSAALLHEITASTAKACCGPEPCAAAGPAMHAVRQSRHQAITPITPMMA